MLQQETLFSIVNQPKLSKEQQQLLSIIQNRPTTAEVYVVQTGNSPAALLKKDMTISIDVYPNKQLTVAGERLIERKSGNITWIGSIQDQYGKVTLTLDHDGITGTLRTETELYKIEPLGEGMQALIHVDLNSFPPNHPAEYLTKTLNNTSDTRDHNTFRSEEKYYLYRRHR